VVPAAGPDVGAPEVRFDDDVGEPASRGTVRKRSTTG
jgi:hypothetical protein